MGWGGWHLHDMTITLTWPFDRCSYLTSHSGGLFSNPQLRNYTTRSLFVSAGGKQKDVPDRGRKSSSIALTHLHTYVYAYKVYTYIYGMVFFGSNPMPGQREIFMRWPTWPTRTPFPKPHCPSLTLLPADLRRSLKAKNSKFKSNSKSKLLFWPGRDSQKGLSRPVAGVYDEKCPKLLLPASLLVYKCTLKIIDIL